MFNNAGWFLMTIGIISCIHTIQKAMKDCTHQQAYKSPKETTEDTLFVPRYIPRIFISAYLSFVISYICQIVKSQISSNDLEDQAILTTITMILLGLPIYNQQSREIIKYSFTNVPTEQSFSCHAENGKVEEEMKRDLRAMMATTTHVRS
ncbi:uncharacterized protein I206_105011 [Kwoniella pini CBS 10737]|uniref:Uncharacterized protein n=1 Tax=Kwoniella pini CBS 10737 TaxID=1296096 RepID=A0A1B9I8J3_9TREE|nr:uncharacterized protein I206_02550 [Kwoniella pini CBS 10737]OCF51834.1 hypothetical protein I206_02550 [Kwoniella pini CBS 10737]